MWGKIKNFFNSLFSPLHKEQGAAAYDSAASVPVNGVNEHSPSSGNYANQPPIGAMPAEKSIGKGLLVPTDHFNAPWVFTDMDVLGLHESDPRLAKRLVPEWQLEGYDKSYNSLIGKARAHCMLGINHMLRMVGLKGAKNAGARHASEIGRECPFWFGCIIPIEHVDSKGRHVALGLYWINEAKRICATLEWNKNNKFDVNVTDLSGKPGADRVIGGFRWPANTPDGQFVSMADVLKKYPFLKSTGKTGGSTQ